MLKFYLFFTLFLISGFLNAQVSIFEGNPSEISRVLSEKISNQSPSDSLILDTPPVPENLSPTRYGIRTSINSGIFSSKGRKEWAIKIVSPKAISLDLVFSELNLAPGSEMYIYSEDRRLLLGPINSGNSSNPLKIFATMPIPGNSAIVRIVEEQGNNSSFRISEVVHGIINPVSNSSTNKALAATASLTCIPDAACYPDWSNEWEMVVRLTVNGAQGTGTFLNNDSWDRKPYILTAFHVLDADNDGVLIPTDISAVSTATVRIDNRSVSCNGTANTGQLFSGATFRAAWHDTDFALIEMTNTPPITSNVNYAGWNRTGVAPSNGTALHHPGGLAMKYAYGSSVQVYPLDWKFWEVTNWYTGIVAPGSSGCALFNQDHQVVGQLRGGGSSCENPNLNDRFGRFGSSWETGPCQCLATNQLRNWLSPSANLSSIGQLSPLTMQGGGVKICSGSSTTITMPYLRAGEVANWSVSSHLSIVSSTANSVTVTASSPSISGEGIITATFSATGAPTVSSNTRIWVGKPSSITSLVAIMGPSSSQLCRNSTGTITVGNSNHYYQGITSYSWNFGTWSSAFVDYDLGGLNSTARAQFSINSSTPSPGTISVTPINSCGIGTAYSSSFYAVNCGSFKLAYPNPAEDILTLEFSNNDNLEVLPNQISLFSENSTKSVKTISIEDIYNTESFKNRSKIDMDVSSLPRGTYYLHVITGKDSNQKIEKTRILLE